MYLIKSLGFKHKTQFNRKGMHFAVGDQFCCFTYPASCQKMHPNPRAARRCAHLGNVSGCLSLSSCLGLQDNKRQVTQSDELKLAPWNQRMFRIGFWQSKPQWSSTHRCPFSCSPQLESFSLVFVLLYFAFHATCDVFSVPHWKSPRSRWTRQAVSEQVQQLETRTWRVDDWDSAGVDVIPTKEITGSPNTKCVHQRQSIHVSMETYFVHWNAFQFHNGSSDGIRTSLPTSIFFQQTSCVDRMEINVLSIFG